MKIVHFTWEYPPVIYGGLGTFATEITQKQKKFGNDITVFSLNENNEYKTYILGWQAAIRSAIIDLDNFELREEYIKAETLEERNNVIQNRLKALKDKHQIRLNNDKDIG